MVNRRFFHPYEAQYDEQHPFFHSSVNGVPLNDIYGRMYSDLNNNYGMQCDGILSVCENFFIASKKEERKNFLTP